MATWGRPARRDRRSSRGATSARKRSRGTARTPSPAQPAAPPAERPGGNLRHAFDGREDEFAGVAMIAGGVLIGLAVYLRLAGPLGRALDALMAWTVGVGRYALPVALVAVGATLVHRGRSRQRARLILGWGLVVGATLSLLHLVRTPGRSLRDAGGVAGGALAEPARALIGGVAATVLLLAALLGGLMLVTKLSVKSLFAHTGQGVGLAGRFARKTFSDLATLSSDRQPSGYPDVIDTMADDPMGPPLVNAPPSVYDRSLEPPAPDGRSNGARQRREPLPPPETPAVGQCEQAELDLGPGAVRGQWVLPPDKALVRTGAQTIDRAEAEVRGHTLEESLRSHGVDTRLAAMTVGPTVTRYELELGPGVKVASVTSLQKDIAYAMAATDVRILAPIPGRSAIGVEVPNKTRQLVALGDVMASVEAKVATHPLEVAIGKDIAGRAVFLNLATTPHLLIAGATGAGKSSAINSIITSMLMRTSPEQVRLILVDPKQVEMGQYARLPHLLTQPVTDPKKAANALGWAVREMERRYDLLYEVGYRDISGYNAAFDRGDLGGDVLAAAGLDEPPAQYERLPYIVVVVDELNDLMMVAARDVEDSITRIAQKARAVGIHLIVATQRPSVNVITGVIKANIPARMAFAVSSLTDSRVILDQPGAEKLVGRGDMLLLPGNSNVAQRIQGCFVSEEEVRKVVAHWRRQAPEVSYVSGVEGDDENPTSGGGFASVTGGDEDDDETLVRQAMDLVVRSQLGSTSMLQRKLKVGFARAGRIMDLLEQRGVVGASGGSKARAVLMTVEEYEGLYGR